MTDPTLADYLASAHDDLRNHLVDAQAPPWVITLTDAVLHKHRIAVADKHRADTATMAEALRAAGWREGPADHRWRHDDRGGAWRIENAYAIAACEARLAGTRRRLDETPERG